MHRKKNTAALSEASKEVDLEVHTEKTKHMVLCGHHSAGKFKIY